MSASLLGPLLPEPGAGASTGPPRGSVRRGARFVNPWLIADGNRMAGFVRWQLGLGPEEERPELAPAEVPSYRPRIHLPDLAWLHRRTAGDELRVTWIGHSTFLVQIAGLNVLTDPIFSARCSPVSFAGPRRHAPPGVPLTALPPIDLVLVSHNHYDHLDRPTVEAIGDRAQWGVPLGVGAWFRKLGIERVAEFDWWESRRADAIRVTAVPAQHFSGRSLFDRNRSLWCGWVITTPAGSIYFAGDSGYGPFFTEIGERLGPFRMGILPIGAYLPRWFMRPVHMDPLDAVHAFMESRCERAVGGHWGTFRLTTEPMAEPPLYLERALAHAGIPGDRFRTLAFGETWRL